MDTAETISQPSPLNPTAPEFIHQLRASNQLGVQQVPHPSDQSAPKFPRNTRHRASLVNKTDPEMEFLQTAVDSCRSTIATQESEIKRLNECLDIRNKRVMNLEAQVAHAAKHVADRGASADYPGSIDSSVSNISTKKLEEAILLILKKLDSPATFPSITIHNNTPNFPSPTQPLLTSRYSQTAAPVESSCTKCPQESNHSCDQPLTCNVCKETDASTTNLDKHFDPHEKPDNAPYKLPSSPEFSCEYCDNKFASPSILLEHTESEHAEACLNCTYCSYI